MSREQANSFKKHRDANDPQGNLTWFARFQGKAMRASPEALNRLDVEREFELGLEEKILWRLMKLARKAMDLEHTGLLPTDKLRGFLRGLVAADVVDILEATEAKALIPAEVKRIKAELTGGAAPKASVGGLRAKVYRPDIDGKPAAEAPAPAPAPKAAPAPVFAAPAPAQKAALSEEDQLNKDNFERAFAAMRGQNHYDFLGLPRGGTDDVMVRQAYVRLAKEYHPDRVAGSALGGDIELQQKVDTLFKRLGEAQAALSTAENRATYDRSLDASGGVTQTAGDGKKVRRPVEAQNAFKMAETFFKKKDMKQAEMHYRQAVQFDWDDPKLLTALAWCIYQNPDHPEDERFQEARKRLIEVTHKHKLADAHYKLGLLCRKQNDEGAAQRQFSAAYKLDPQHVDAAREVRLTEMREKKIADEKSGGMLGKFLRK